MPPAAVKTIRDLVYWEYAKLVSEIAVGDRKNYRFVMATYQRYKRSVPHPLEILRQNGLESKGFGECAFCNSKENLEMDLLIPISRSGPDRPDNQVQICAKCNRSRNGREIFHWFGKERRYEIPRLVMARYLKLIFDIHNSKNNLDSIHGQQGHDFDIFDLAAPLESSANSVKTRKV